MQFLTRFISRSPNLPKYLSGSLHFRPFSAGDNFSWDTAPLPSWSTGIDRDHHIGQNKNVGGDGGGGGGDESGGKDEWREKMAELEKEGRKQREMVDRWAERELETHSLIKQVVEPGARGSYLKDSEKAEMYRKHRDNPEVYTVEKLAKEYRIMRQRVHAILWLKKDEEEEERMHGEPLDDTIEQILDNFPYFFNSHDREYHVATLPRTPNFKVMPEGWDGTTRDPDEVLYEISKKEDDMLYEEFLEKFNFNKMKLENKVKVHRYARRRSSDGWEFTVEMLGKRGKRGGGGGWKFVSRPDGSTRQLNEMEKMYLRREKPRRRLKPFPPMRSFREKRFQFMGKKKRVFRGIGSRV